MYSVIINFCSNEKQFLKSLLEECSHFANEIIISYTDQLYNGQIEDMSFLNDYINVNYKNVNVKFVKYNIDLNLPHEKRLGVIHRPTAYWHNLARYTAIQNLSNNIEWVFIIDADEIPDGKRTKEWLDDNVLYSNYCYKIATYWYFKLPIFQSKTYEDSILLINKKFLNKETIFGDMERDHTIQKSGCTLQRMVLGLDNIPLWNHYSWVRSKDGIRKKISGWAHANDIFQGVDVEKVIEYIYKDNNVNDFVHKYEYNIVPNKFSINLD